MSRAPRIDTQSSAKPYASTSLRVHSIQKHHVRSRDPNCQCQTSVRRRNINNDGIRNRETCEGDGPHASSLSGPERETSSQSAVGVGQRLVGDDHCFAIGVVGDGPWDRARRTRFLSRRTACCSIGHTASQKCQLELEPGMSPRVEDPTHARRAPWPEIVRCRLAVFVAEEDALEVGTR